VTALWGDADRKVVGSVFLGYLVPMRDFLHEFYEKIPLHYEALDVPEDASLEVIRASWHEIAKQCHPDRADQTSGEADRFRLASEAWSVLRHPASRALYDQVRAQARVPRPPPSQPPPPRPPPPQPPPPRTRAENAEQEAIRRTSQYDDINGIRSMGTDDLLQALLADAVLRASTSKPRLHRKTQKSPTTITISPGFKVSLEGDAAESLRDMRKGLGFANKLILNINRFLKR